MFAGDWGSGEAADLAEVLRVVRQAWLSPRSCSLDRSVESKSGKLVEEPGIMPRDGDTMGTGARTTRARRRDAALPNRRYSVPETVMRRYALSKQRSVSVSGSSGVATVPVGTPDTPSIGRSSNCAADDAAGPRSTSDESAEEHPRARRHSDNGPGLGASSNFHLPETPSRSPKSSSRADPKSKSPNSPRVHDSSEGADFSQTMHGTPNQRSKEENNAFLQAEAPPSNTGDANPGRGSDDSIFQITPAADLVAIVDDGTNHSPVKTDRTESSMTLDQTVSEHSLSTQDMTVSVLSDSVANETSPKGNVEVVDASFDNKMVSNLPEHETPFSNDCAPLSQLKVGKEQCIACEKFAVGQAISEQGDTERKFNNLKNTESCLNAVHPQDIELSSLSSCNLSVDTNEPTGGKSFTSEQTSSNEVELNYTAESGHHTFLIKETQTTYNEIPSEKNSNLGNIPPLNDVNETLSIAEDFLKETLQNDEKCENCETRSENGLKEKYIEIKTEISSSQMEVNYACDLKDMHKHLVSGNVCTGSCNSRSHEKLLINEDSSPRESNRESSSVKSVSSAGLNESSVYRTSDTSIDMSIETPTECCITTPETEQMQSMSDGLTESRTITPLGHTPDSNSAVSDKSELRYGAVSSTTLNQTVSDRSTSTQDTTASVTTDAATSDGDSAPDARRNSSTTLYPTLSDHSESTQDMTLSIPSESFGIKSAQSPESSNRRESSANTLEVSSSTTLDQSISDNSSSTQDMTISIKSETSPPLEKNRQPTPYDKQTETIYSEQAPTVTDRSTSTNDMIAKIVPDAETDDKIAHGKHIKLNQNDVVSTSMQTISAEQTQFQEIAPTDYLETSRRHTILSPVREDASSRQSGEITNYSSSSQDLEHIAFMEDKSPRAAKSNVESIFHVIKPASNHNIKFNDTEVQINNRRSNNFGHPVFLHQNSNIHSFTSSSIEVTTEDGKRGKLESKRNKDIGFQNILPSKPQAAELCGSRYYPLQAPSTSGRNKDVEFVPVNDLQISNLDILTNLLGASVLATDKNSILNNGLHIRSESPSSVLSRTAYNWSHLSDKGKHVSPMQRDSNWLQNREQTSFEPENLSSCFATGSSYRKTVQTELAIPRYSALPRTVSMLVNTSSGDCSSNSDSDSECLSLVDSLEDTTPPRRVRRSAEVSCRKSPKGDSREILDEGARRTPLRVQAATPRGMAKAFFVSISENEINDKNLANKSRMVSESMPDKLKDKLSQRHQQMAVKRIEKGYSSDPLKSSTEESKQSTRYKYKMRRYLKKTKQSVETPDELSQKKAHEKLQNENMSTKSGLGEKIIPETSVKQESVEHGIPEQLSKPEVQAPLSAINKNDLEESLTKSECAITEVNVNSNTNITPGETNITDKNGTVLFPKDVSDKMNVEADNGNISGECGGKAVDGLEQQCNIQEAWASQTSDMSVNSQTRQDTAAELDRSSAVISSSETYSGVGDYTENQSITLSENFILENEHRTKREILEKSEDGSPEATETSPVNESFRNIANELNSERDSSNTHQVVPVYFVDVTGPVNSTKPVTNVAANYKSTTLLNPVHGFGSELANLKMNTLYEHDEDSLSNDSHGHFPEYTAEAEKAKNISQIVNNDHGSNKLLRSHIPVMKSPIGLYKINKEPLRTTIRPEIMAEVSKSVTNTRPPRPLQQSPTNLRRSANLLVNKFQQRFEVIPEEKSGSLESSTEDQTRLIAENNNKTYMKPTKLLSSKSVEINNSTSSGIPVLVNANQDKSFACRNSNANYQANKTQQRRYRNRFSAPQRRNSENIILFKNSESCYCMQARYEKYKIRKENINEVISDIKNAVKLDNVDSKLIVVPESEKCTCNKASENKTENVPETIQADKDKRKSASKCSTKTENVSATHLHEMPEVREPHHLKEYYKGKASIALNSQDSELLSLSKGWINFYLLKGNQGTPDESTTEDGGTMISDKEDKCRTQGSVKTVSVMGADEERVRQCTVATAAARPDWKTPQSSVATLPQIQSSRRQSLVAIDGLQLELCPSPDSDHSTVYLRPPAMTSPRRRQARCDVLDGSGDLACSESSSSSSSDTSRDNSGDRREAISPPLLPLRWPIRQRRPPRLSRSRSRVQHYHGEVTPYPLHCLQQNPCVGGGNGWTVTVAGTTTYPQQEQDVELRLSFPACARRQPASQSDSGLGEDNHGDSAQHFLPPAHHFNIVVKNQADGLDGGEEMKTEKIPHQCLPDITYSTGQLKHTNKIFKRPGTGVPACSAVDEDTRRARARRRLSLCSWPKVHASAAQCRSSITKNGRSISQEARPTSRQLDDDRGILVLESGLTITGSAITPEKKPRVPTMSERDLTRIPLGKSCVATNHLG